MTFTHTDLFCLLYLGCLNLKHFKDSTDKFTFQISGFFFFFAVSGVIGYLWDWSQFLVSEFFHSVFY